MVVVMMPCMQNSQNSFPWFTPRSPPQSQSQKQGQSSGSYTRNPNTTMTAILSSSLTNTNTNTSASFDSDYYYEYGYGGYDGYDDEPPPKRVKMMNSRRSLLADASESPISVESSPQRSGLVRTESVQSVEMVSVNAAENASDTVSTIDSSGLVGSGTIDDIDAAFARLVPVLPSSAFTVPDPLPPDEDRGASSSTLQSESPDVSPSISGSFHFFNVYPSDTSLTAGPSQYERLYQTLCSSSPSTPRVVSAQCFIPTACQTTVSDSQTLGPGLVQSAQIRDPINNEILDIALTNLRRQTVEPEKHLCETARSDKLGPNNNSSDTESQVVGEARLIGEGSIGDIVDAFGEFVLKCVWRKRVTTLSSSASFTRRKAETTLELFQGQLSFKVFYGEAYAERGIDDVGDHELTFWAVRSENQRLSEKDVKIAVERARARGAAVLW